MACGHSSLLHTKKRNPKLNTHTLEGVDAHEACQALYFSFRDRDQAHMRNSSYQVGKNILVGGRRNYVVQHVNSITSASGAQEKTATKYQPSFVSGDRIVAIPRLSMSQMALCPQVSPD